MLQSISKSMPKWKHRISITCPIIKEQPEQIDALNQLTSVKAMDNWNELFYKFTFNINIFSEESSFLQFLNKKKTSICLFIAWFRILTELFTVYH